MAYRTTPRDAGAKGTEDLRAGAEEILARAETFHNAVARQTLHKIAANYERMADRLEECAGDDAGSFRSAGKPGQRGFSQANWIALTSLSRRSDSLGEISSTNLGWPVS